MVTDLFFTREVMISQLVVGKKYKVTLRDCCIEGEFTSVLLEKKDEELLFQNGIKLTLCWQCLFEEINEF